MHAKCILGVILPRQKLFTFFSPFVTWHFDIPKKKERTGTKILDDLTSVFRPQPSYIAMFLRYFQKVSQMNVIKCKVEV